MTKKKEPKEFIVIDEGLEHIYCNDDGDDLFTEGEALSLCGDLIKESHSRLFVAKIVSEVLEVAAPVEVRPFGA